jgi:O-antigen/teichoic acid export membrane protein
MGHHALHVALQAPNLALPVLVTTSLSAATNAFFYIAWTMAGFIFVFPAALTTVLYAVGARNPAALGAKVRFTLGLSLLGGLVTNVALLLGADHLLVLFGAAYASEAGASLLIIALGVFPLIVKDHFVAIYRVRGQVGAATVWVAAGGALELAMAAVGGVLGGLVGLAIAWVAALCIEILPMAATVYRTALPPRATAEYGPDGSSPLRSGFSVSRPGRLVLFWPRASRAAGAGATRPETTTSWAVPASAVVPIVRERVK